MFPLASLVYVGLLSWGVSAIPLEPRTADLSATLKKVNQVLEDLGLSERVTSDQSFSSFFVRGSIRNAKIGQLDTFSVRGEQQFINNTVVEDVTVTYFDVNVGLDNFYVSYDYEYSFLYVFGGRGSARISAGKDAARLVGTISRGKNSCQAVLHSAQLTEFSSFEATIQPRTIFNTVLSKVLVFLHNHVYTSDISTFNNIFSDAIKKDSFRNEFSKVLCLVDS